MNFLKKNPFLVLGSVLLALGVIFLAASYFSREEMSDRAEVVSDITYVHEGDFKFEIADSPEKQVQGLSGRTSIDDHYGMLFVFETPRIPGFWMKDMNFAIDIIWLSDTGEILGVEDSVSPDSYPNVFEPSVPVSYVLETRAGYARDRGWEVGETILLPILK